MLLYSHYVADEFSCGIAKKHQKLSFPQTHALEISDWRYSIILENLFFSYAENESDWHLFVCQDLLFHIFFYPVCVAVSKQRENNSKNY